MSNKAKPLTKANIINNHNTQIYIIGSPNGLPIPSETEHKKSRFSRLSVDGSVITHLDTSIHFKTII